MSAHFLSLSFPFLLHRSWSRQIHRATEGAGATQAEPSLPHYFSKQLNTFIETPVVMSVLCVCVPSVPLRVPQPEQPLLPGELGRGHLRCFHEVGTQILVFQYGTRWSFRSYIFRKKRFCYIVTCRVSEPELPGAGVFGRSRHFGTAPVLDPTPT